MLRKVGERSASVNSCAIDLRDVTACATAALTVSPAAQRNRAILLGLMSAAGWDFYKNEWWHYQLFNSRSFPVYAEADLKLGLM